MAAELARRLVRETTRNKEAAFANSVKSTNLYDQSLDSSNFIHALVKQKNIDTGRMAF